MIDLNALETLAAAATSGKRRWADWSATFGTMEDPERMTSLEVNRTYTCTEPVVRRWNDEASRILKIEEPSERPADAALIAALDRETVLELIRLARIGEAVEANRETLASMADSPSLLGLTQDETRALIAILATPAKEQP